MLEEGSGDRAPLRTPASSDAALAAPGGEIAAQLSRHGVKLFMQSGDTASRPKRYSDYSPTPAAGGFEGLFRWGKVPGGRNLQSRRGPHVCDLIVISALEPSSRGTWMTKTTTDPVASKNSSARPPKNQSGDPVFDEHLRPPGRVGALPPTPR